METVNDGKHWHHSSGRQFENAFYILIGKFDAINTKWLEEIQNPSYYCAGLAIEHFLKSHLSLKGIAFSKRNGHDLKYLISLDRDTQGFFDLDDVDLAQIKLLNERYFNQETYGKDDLRYPSKFGPRRSPHPDSLNRIIKKMDKKLTESLWV